jgi:hypothetical protein
LVGHVLDGLTGFLEPQQFQALYEGMQAIYNAVQAQTEAQKKAAEEKAGAQAVAAVESAEGASPGAAAAAAERAASAAGEARQQSEKVGEAVSAISRELAALSETMRAIQEAVAETWAKILEPVQHMADKLSGKDAIFRDTLVTNVQDIVKLIPALNLTNDARMREAARVIEEKLASLSADDLRNNKVVRKEAAEAAKAIAARFSGMGVRKFAEAA